MRDVVAVDDVVVPVALALSESRALEAESAFPAAGFVGVFGQGQLAVVVVPRADQVDGLAVGGGTEGEVELDCCHFELGVLVDCSKDRRNYCWMWNFFWFD